MATQEVPRDEWVRFCNDYSRQHEGWLTTVQVKGGSAGERVEVRSLPLRGLSFEEKGTGRDAINIFLSPGADQDETHIVDHPKHIRFENKSGMDEGLEIEGQDGTTTILHFDKPARPEHRDRI